MVFKYVATISRETSSGVKKKIYAQVKAIKALGVKVELSFVTRNTGLSSVPGKGNCISNSATFHLRRINEKIRLSKELSSVISKNIICSGAETVIYIRGLKPTQSLIRVLRKERRCLVVFELQSFAEVEAKQRGSWDTVLAMTFFYGRALRYADGIVGVTNEIALHYFKMSKRRDLPYLVNGNGIDVNSVPIRTPTPFDGKNLDLLCVAQVAKWHGLDRLIKGIAQYRGNVNVRLHVVGDGSEISYLKRLVAGHKLENSVIFHGFKTGKELDGFFDKCHIAVGSIGTHRKGMVQTSQLKTREYCARGIPFCFSAEDDDFSSEMPYVFRVPADESSIDVSGLVCFTSNILADPQHSSKMRNYAQEHLDWKVKTRRLVRFLNEVLLKKEIGETS